jgi:hypothetical protein
LALGTDTLLDAGAVLDESWAAGERCDVLNYRAYTHPALAGRVVVRLVPATLGEAEDLVMDFLGFDAPADVGVVGAVRVRALGFPAWALVHDKANARHAIALVKDIERLSRLAMSKPGHAKDGFESLASVLAAAVPHFLPAFFEQAARSFLAVGNEQLAGVMFGKARAAERAHGLAVDEESQSSAFIEFALAGALTTKALTAYAKSLSARCPPAEAYSRFRCVCVERIAGGLPPYPEMPADLRRLVKAAKLDQDAEDQSVLRELLPFPAMIRAGRRFWETYQKPLADLARAEPGVRGTLLNLNPQIPDLGVPAADELWLSILEAGRATDGLIATRKSVPDEAMPRDGAAGWLSRFARGHCESERSQAHWPPRELLSLVARMAPRLRADGDPVRLDHDRHASVDLLDACLAAGIPVADPIPGIAFPTSIFLADHDTSRPDLMALATDGRFRPALLATADAFATAGRIRNATFFDIPGLRTVFAAWLEIQADVLQNDGIPDVESALKKLVRLSQYLPGDDVRAMNPAARARMEAFDAAAMLAHALRLGILDEFGWSALEEACAELARPNRGQHGWRRPKLRVADQWPYLVVADEAKAAVVTHDRILHRQDLSSLPANRRGHPILPGTDGRLAVSADDLNSAEAVTSCSHLKHEVPAFFVAQPDSGTRSVAAVIRFPGTSADVGVVHHSSESPKNSDQITLVSPQGQTLACYDVGEQNPDYARGTICVPPWRFWHFLTLRDAAGSALLREVTADRVRPLLDIAAEPADATMLDRASRALVEIPPDEKVVDAVLRALPEITDPNLRSGVAVLARRARLCANLAMYERWATVRSIGHPPSAESG